MDQIKNWKTTVTALVGAIAMLVGHFGFDIGPEIQTTIISVVVLIIGFLSKDADKTGTNSAPR